jgi:hypothetical protein
MPPNTYIYEFPHPRFVIHYHQGSDDDIEDLTIAQDALDHRVHGLELDLNYFDDNQTVVVGEEGADSDSPTLVSALEYIVKAKGASPTMYGDGFQFFLALDMKETITELLDGVFEVLTSAADWLTHHLSTAVRPGDEPRGITVVITGPSRQFYERHVSEELNRLCIVDGNADWIHDYTAVSDGAPEITNLSPAQTPFQWVSLDHSIDAERGRVNDYHRDPAPEMGPGQYNVRTYGEPTDGGELELQFATGADSANCESSSIATFRGIIRDQMPRGFSPWLNVRGSRALLTWRGRTFGADVYAALGMVEQAELDFSRQLDLTYFLPPAPLGMAPAGALTRDERLFMVYEGTDAQRLWYTSGRFTSADRFLTFDGRQHRLTLDDGSRSGSNPAVAVAPDGRIVVVYEGTDAQRLWYVTGTLAENGEFLGQEFELTLPDDSRRGYNPSIAIDEDLGVLVVYEGTGGQRLWYVSGYLAPSGEIVGNEHQLTEPDDSRRGSTPAVAIDTDKRILVVYEGTDEQRLWYVSGYRDGTGRIAGNEFPLTEGDARRGSHPTVALGGGEGIILYQGTDEAKLWYVQGMLDAAGMLVGQEHLLTMSTTEL